MPRVIKTFSRFIGGIADYDREGIPDSHAFSRAVDFRTNPQNLTLLPVAIKESGSVYTDLPKWGEVYNSNLTSYIYGNSGNLYSRTLAGVHTFLRQVNNSHGNGFVYSQEDDFLYYAGDKVIGRYGPLASSTPTFVDDFFGSQGGVPLNTNSLTLLSASSQYADRADTASLSITGDLSISAQINPTTLPASGSSMVIASKWNINGNLRSYMLDIAGVSGYFGDGSDGVLTISTNTTESPIDSACTGTVGTTTLSATNVSFTAGQIILIHQTQGTGAGQYQRNTISSYTAGTITLTTALNATYVTGSQVRVLKQYSAVTINAGITYTPKPWNGTTGGLFGFICSGTFTNNNIVDGNGTSLSGNNAGGPAADGGGFRGGQAFEGANTFGGCGEGTGGTARSTQTTSANGNGGGGGYSGNRNFGDGGGGGNGLAGGNGDNAGGTSTGGIGGSTAGSADLTSLVMGGGGGASGGGAGTDQGGGGNGGAIIFITSANFVNLGTIRANGGNGGVDLVSAPTQGGGGGGGGSVLIKAQTATLGTITASGGTGGAGAGSGGVGRITLDYYTSYTAGTITPTLNAIQDNSLVTNTSYQLRLSVSSTGTNSETLAQTFVPQTGVWQQVGVSWVSSTSTATFYLNAVSLGTRVGTLTSIVDNAARFAVGCSFDSGGSATNFYNGQIDEVQIYNMTQTPANFLSALTSQISTTSAGLVAYYKFNGDYTDATSNTNDLTSHGTPSFTANVPFPSPSTRLDQDQSATTAGNTYTPLTAISEAAVNRLTFTPGKDPQKSMAVLVAAKGTGDWTITIHDTQNTIIATSTITTANMSTGYIEFPFSSLWRPLTGFTNPYHAHITSTVADGTITCTTAGNCETISYRTYYQFLVTDTAWHPMARFLQFWVVGNGKWVGKYEATLYEPNKIALGAGWKVRCFGKWGEYIVFGAMRDTTNIYSQDAGRLYFWDGSSPTYNYPVEVPSGGVNALLSDGDTLYIWAGYKNQLLKYTGGLSVQKVKFLPKMENNTYSETYPQAVAMWQSLLRWGASGNSNSTTLPRGVYTWGKSSIRYPEVLSCDYIPSTGNSGSTVSIGLLMVVNQRLLVGWQDGVGFGVDYVDSTTASFGSGTIEFLIDDQDEIWKVKEALNFKAVFAPLNSGDSVTLKFKKNDQSSFTTTTSTTTVGDTSLILSIPQGREMECQIACDVSTSASTTPTIKGYGFEVNTLDEEKGIGATNE